MKNKSPKGMDFYLKIYSVAISILFIISIFYFLDYNSGLLLENEDKDKEINLLNNSLYELETMYNQLNNEYGKLSMDLVVMNDIIEDKEEEYEKVSVELEDTYADLEETLEEFEDKIQDSMEWFSFNSELNKSIPEQYKMIRKLRGECLDESHNFCSINLACPFFINERVFQMKYYNDNLFSDSEDKLFSIQEFLDHEGGDCEDYSLFYKAQMNSLLNECEGKDLEFRAWYDGEYKSKFFVENDKEWFLEGVSEYEFEEEKFPNIVCGNMYDVNSGEINGHCLIAFTKHKIDDIDSLEYFDNSVLIEPQTGEYMGRVNGDSGIYIEEDNTVKDSESYIYTVITDNDMYIYDYEEISWTSYSTFLEKIENI